MQGELVTGGLAMVTEWDTASSAVQNTHGHAAGPGRRGGADSEVSADPWE